VEETALAVEALAAVETGGQLSATLQRGLRWLVEKIQQNRHRHCSPIGFYFAKLWYYERLYPLTFTVGALGRAAHLLAAEGSSNLASPCRPAERTP
jgi:squalene-hopene/tetraprenyl-beta-curcumene cyclase